jgi:Zn-finger nucleic acid-binding protein
MICPRCSTQLLMSDKHGVEIDYCPNCRGIWLDKGELEKIIEREYSMTSKNNRFNDDDDDDDHYDNQKNNGLQSNQRRKKSFWGDLLDF